jgi:malonate transporter MadM subunit
VTETPAFSLSALVSDTFSKVLAANGLVVAFLCVGLLVWFSYFLSRRLTAGRIHGSAIAIALGLALAWVGGSVTGGSRGLADFSLLTGIGLMGGAMLRDFAIVATAFGADLGALKRAGLVGALSIVIGVVLSFATGALVAVAFGYSDAIAITTIGAGAATYIVGPVTGDALGASSEVIALSVAAGLTKSVLVMIGTPLVAKRIGLDNPHAAMIYGGLMGTTSGVAGGLAATDPKLVPYGAMTATFYTGVGCLLAPSVLYFVVRALT